MKKLLFATLLALPLLATPARASGWGGCAGSYQVGVGFGFSYYCRPCPPPCGPCGGGGGGGGGGSPGQAGPWYLYWPLEAHFQTPAPITYPFWPAQMGIAPGSTLGPADAAVHPAGYHAPQGPAYWYGW